MYTKSSMKYLVKSINPKQKKKESSYLKTPEENHHVSSDASCEEI